MLWISPVLPITVMCTNNNFPFSGSFYFNISTLTHCSSLLSYVLSIIFLPNLWTLYLLVFEYCVFNKIHFFFFLSRTKTPCASVRSLYSECLNFTCMQSCENFLLTEFSTLLQNVFIHIFNVGEDSKNMQISS